MLFIELQHGKRQRNNKTFLWRKIYILSGLDFNWKQILLFQQHRNLKEYILSIEL